MLDAVPGGLCSGIVKAMESTVGVFAVVWVPGDKAADVVLYDDLCSSGRGFWCPRPSTCCPAVHSQADRQVVHWACAFQALDSTRSFWSSLLLRAPVQGESCLCLLLLLLDALPGLLAWPISQVQEHLLPWLYVALVV